MNQMEQLYLSLLKEKNLKNLPYSHDYLTNPAYQTPNKAVVLAAGTGGGKTIISILWSMMYYQNPLNKGNLTLILPASKTILRENYSTELAKLNPSFSWREVKDKAQLIEAINDGVEVIIGLPQTIMKNYTLLPKVDRFILDEAHEWYFAKGKNGNEGSIQKLIKHINPTEQLLLTGTPSKFVAKGNDFIFKFVPILELYELGQVGNVKLEVVSSSYDFKSDDWKGTYGNLKGNKTNSKKEAEHSLKLVCNEMLNKLKNKYKNLHSLNNITGNKIGWLFNYLEKTTIYTHSKKQANAFYTILNEIPELKGKIRKSHSENDPTSKEFKEFKDGVDEFGNQVDIKILIAVDRGRIGFNMPELFHIIDFTMTQNLDMLLQMYGRLLRVSDLNPNKQKIYFKVATKNTADYFVDLMTAMLCLTNMEWYSKYNGKNMGGIRIPKVLTKKRNKPSKSSGKSTSTSKPYISLEELGIPLDLNFFKNSILHSSNDLFSTIAWTTLDDVRREFFNLQHRTISDNLVNYEEGKIIVAPLKLGSYAEWTNFTKTDEFKNNPIYQKLPVGLIGHYGQTNEWVSSGDFFGYSPHHGSNWASFDEFKQFMLDNNLSNGKQFEEFCKKGERPINIPSNPHMIYEEWAGWDYLFKDKIVYTESQIIKEFKDCKNRSEADRKNNQMFYQMSEELKNKMFGLLPKDIHYNIEDIIEEACKSDSEFQWGKNSKVIYPKAVHNKSMFAYARNNKLMDTIRSNKNVKIAWALSTITNKELADLAKTFKTKGEFTDKHERLLRMAKRRGIWNKISSHMVSTLKYWTLDRFNEIIKEHNLTNKQQLRTFKGANLRKVAYELDLWDTFPNAKKGNSVNNLILI